MNARQYDDIKTKIQDEIDRLEKMENESVEEQDYANALYSFHHRLGLLHAWQIIVKSENVFNP